MVAFWSALLGALVGGALSLLGVRLTLNKQSERDRSNDERQLRDRKHDRLRAAYRDVVSVSEHFPRDAAALALLETLVRKGDAKPDAFLDKLKEPSRDTSQARAILLLEDDQDREVLKKLADISTAHLSFTGFLISEMYEGKPDLTEARRRIDQMSAQAEELATLARVRLAELDKPV